MSYKQQTTSGAATALEPNLSPKSASKDWPTDVRDSNSMPFHESDLQKPAGVDFKTWLFRTSQQLLTKGSAYQRWVGMEQTSLRSGQVPNEKATRGAVPDRVAPGGAPGLSVLHRRGVEGPRGPPSASAKLPLGREFGLLGVQLQSKRWR